MKISSGAFSAKKGWSANRAEISFGLSPLHLVSYGPEVAAGFSASRLLALADWSLSETASPIHHCWFVSAFRGNGFCFDGTGVGDGHLVTAKWGDVINFSFVNEKDLAG
jgi:hypothetical protein